ncbi:medium chain dehydrogenase/reductase family protein [Aerosakkonemataceae cyanobacterium BLCC-F154]|uniref:Medium chain dehydrogenase/reductase family protein n=1 Tax=Floridaenema fluviatile BLCC-F154 TaxID=3153640 RepID=A0ABV4YJE1_9CYAN
MKYKQVVITRHGSSEVLQVTEDEIPEPKSNEVRVKVLATSAAFTDVLVREGIYPGTPKVPFSPGYDIVGIVDKLGAEVSNLELGKIVVAMTIFGGYTEFICLPETELIPVPSEVNPVEAVCLPLSYLTAYQMLHRIAKVQSGERILVHGAGGAVGMALSQLGKLAELQIYGTASQGKHEFVSSLGAIPIDYKNEDFVSKIRELTSDGVDVVFDGVGGNYIPRSYKILRPKGRLVNYGFSGVLKSKNARLIKLVFGLGLLSILNLIPDEKEAIFYSVADAKKKHPDWFREDLTQLLQLLKNQQIQPKIAAIMPLLEASRAHELVENSAVSGKIILACNT